MDRRTLLQHFRLYAVTDFKEESPDAIKKVEAAYRGGADIVQLRSKTLPDAALFRLGQKIRQIATAAGKLFFVNDRPDLVFLLDADGVHLGQEDLPVAAVRKMFAEKGQQFLIGKSTHSLAQAQAAEAEGVDYLAVGPIFKTPTKGDYPPVGLDLIRQVTAQSCLPIVAIGGIHTGNLEQVLEAGARRVAVVRAIFASEDVYGATRKLRETIDRHLQTAS